MRDLCMSVDTKKEAQEEQRKYVEKKKRAEAVAAAIFEVAKEQWQKATNEGKQTRELVIWFMGDRKCYLSVVDGEKIQLSDASYNFEVSEAVRRIFMSKHFTIRAWEKCVFNGKENYNELHLHEMQKPKSKS